MNKVKQIGSAFFKALFPPKIWHVRIPYCFFEMKHFDIWNKSTPEERKELLNEEVRIYQAFLKGRILISCFGDYKNTSPKVDIIRLQ